MPFRSRPLFSVGLHALIVLCLLLTLSATATADELVVDPARSALRFTVTKWGFVEVVGHVRRFSGAIQWNPQRPQDARTSWEARVDSIETGEPKRDRSLLAPEYFDAVRFPRVAFASTRASVVDRTTLRIQGELTLRGVTRPVEGVVRWLDQQNSEEGGQVFETVLTVNRRDFGIVGGRLLGPVISDEVQITVRAVARPRT